MPLSINLGSGTRDSNGLKLYLCSDKQTKLTHGEKESSFEIIFCQNIFSVQRTASLSRVFCIELVLIGSIFAILHQYWEYFIKIGF